MDPNQIKEARAWMARQPEYENEYATFREQAVIIRLWTETRRELDALNERIAHLEKTGVPLAEFQPGDKLLITYENVLSREARARLTSALEAFMQDHKRPIAVLEADPRVYLLRNAVGQPAEVGAAPEQGAVELVSKA